MAADFPPASAALCLETLGVTTTSPEEVPASYIIHLYLLYLKPNYIVIHVQVAACAESSLGAELLHQGQLREGEQQMNRAVQ